MPDHKLKHTIFQLQNIKSSRPWRMRLSGHKGVCMHAGQHLVCAGDGSGGDAVLLQGESCGQHRRLPRLLRAHPAHRGAHTPGDLDTPLLATSSSSPWQCLPASPVNAGHLSQACRQGPNLLSTPRRTFCTCRPRPPLTGRTWRTTLRALACSTRSPCRRWSTCW